MDPKAVEAAREKLKAKMAAPRLGGKGTVRRKVKTVHKAASMDDKRLQGTLKRLGVNQIPGIEEVNLFKDDGSVIHFENPKVQASLPANTYVVSGTAENKTMQEMLPTLLSQMSGLGGLSGANLKLLTEQLAKGNLGNLGGAPPTGDDEEMPALEGNFDENN